MFKSGRSLLPVAGFLLLATACTPISPKLKGKTKHLIQDVPFYPENRYWCGPASLAGVMNYWKESPKPDQIAKKTYSPSAGGTLMADLAWYAREHGFAAKIKHSSFKELQSKISEDIPVIVFVNREGLLQEYNHFMVVVGYTTRGFIVNSGLNKQQFITRSDFQRLWRKNDRYAIFITPVS